MGLDLHIPLHHQLQMEKELKVTNELPGHPHNSKVKFITISDKSEVGDGAITGQQQTCDVVNMK